MAGIEKLKDRIIKDGEDKAKQIKDDAGLKAQDIIKRAEEKAQTMIEDAKAKGLKMSGNRKDRIISNAKLEARNMKLAQKQKTIDEIFKKAADFIKSMEKDKYTSFLEKLLLNNIETGEEEIVFSKNDIERLDPSFVERLNQKLLSEGKKGSLKLKDEIRDIGSGAVLINGKVEIDCSIDSQLKAIRDDLEGELADLLFENEK
jgi:V/A-type H+-transporting ATPase subunit E